MTSLNSFLQRAVLGGHDGVLGRAPGLGLRPAVPPTQPRGWGSDQAGRGRVSPGGGGQENGHDPGRQELQPSGAESEGRRNVH